MHPLEGTKQSPEHIAKRVAKQTGQKRTAEAKEKMAAAKRGTKYSEERLERNMERLKNPKQLNTPDAKAKMAKTKMGVPRTPEAIASMSAAQKRRWERCTEAERVAIVEAWIEAGQIASKRVVKDTTIEKMVEETLKASGVEYIKQFRVSYYQCDFYIPSTHTVIEVNGCYYHQCPICGYSNLRTEEIRAKDARKLAYLQSKGYTVNIIWEHDIIDGYKVRKPNY